MLVGGYGCCCARICTLPRDSGDCGKPPCACLCCAGPHCRRPHPQPSGLGAAGGPVRQWHLLMFRSCILCRLCASLSPIPLFAAPHPAAPGRGAAGQLRSQAGGGRRTAGEGRAQHAAAGRRLGAGHVGGAERPAAVRPALLLLTHAAQDLSWCSLHNLRACERRAKGRVCRQQSPGTPAFCASRKKEKKEKNATQWRCSRTKSHIYKREQARQQRQGETRTDTVWPAAGRCSWCRGRVKTWEARRMHMREGHESRNQATRWAAR